MFKNLWKHFINPTKLAKPCPKCSWLRCVCDPVDEVASMEIDVPVTMDRNQWLTQQASESTIDKGKVIYITDQDNHWDAKRIPFPTGEDEDWVYIGQTLAPGYEIVDVHFTDVSAHVYIKRRKA